MRLFLTTLLAVSLLSLQPPKADVLSNTNWSGTLHAPDPVDGVLEFKNDSVHVYIGPDLIETMTYQVKGDTLTLTKVSGASSCDQQPADYKYTIAQDQLTLTSLNDQCSDRKNAFSAEGYKKMN